MPFSGPLLVPHWAQESFHPQGLRASEVPRRKPAPSGLISFCLFLMSLIFHQLKVYVPLDLSAPYI